MEEGQHLMMKINVALEYFHRILGHKNKNYCQCRFRLFMKKTMKILSEIVASFQKNSL